VSDNIDHFLTGPVKNAMGTGTSKVIQWMSALVNDYTAIRQHDSLQPLTASILKREDKAVVSITNRVFPLLGHREEVVREGAVVLLAQLFALDVAVNRPPGPPEKSSSASSSPAPVQPEVRRRSQSEEVSSVSMASAVTGTGEGEGEGAVDPLLAEAQALAWSLSPAMGKSLLENVTGSSAAASSYVNSRVVRLSNEYIAKLSTGNKVTPSAKTAPVAAATKKALSSLTEKRKAGKLKLNTKRKGSAGGSDCEISLAAPSQDTGRLSNMLFEAQLILRNPVLSSRDVWDDFSQV
jgi:hypothetical protein